MPTPTVEIVTVHREALALACYEEHANASKIIGIDEGDRNHEYYRLACNDIKFRNTALTTPRIRERYIAIRGFDPREVQAAPKLRWLS